MLQLDDVMGTEGNMEQTSGYVMTAPSLLALPDDVLLLIMSYLRQTDLFSMAQLSERLDGLSHDRTLWTVVDAREAALTDTELVTVVEHLQPFTRTLATRGTGSTSLCKDLIHKICAQCPVLETLILEHLYAEISTVSKAGKVYKTAQSIHLKMFPKTLTTLSFKGCSFKMRKSQESFFHDIQEHMPSLKVLILSGCAWVHPYDFISIAKCSKLEELRLDGCYRLGECVAYTSLATRFGFHSLKILDLRETNMGDSDVSCFNRTASLTHLYLERPSNPKHQLNSIVNCCNTRFPEGSPIIVISRLGDDVQEIRAFRSAADMVEGPSSTTETIGMRPRRRSERPQAPGPSTSTSSDSQIKVPTESSCSVWLCPGPSSSSSSSGENSSLKRKSESMTENGKRTKLEQSDASDVSSDESDCCANSPMQHVCGRRRQHRHSPSQPYNPRVEAEESDISDLCISSFAEQVPVNQNDGGPPTISRNLVNAGNLWYVRLMYSQSGGGRPNLHTLVLRNFSRVTDSSLRSLATYSSLRYLDVTGTSVTESAVLNFKLRRPEVEVISDFDIPF